MTRRGARQVASDRALTNRRPRLCSAKMAALDTLLARTSRTFAIAIPLLPAPLAREVTAAYLLLRIADTLEDADSWPPRERIAALAALAALLRTPSLSEAERLAPMWVQTRPCEDEHCLALLAALPAVVQEIQGFPAARRTLILHHTARIIRGMMGFLHGADDQQRLMLSSEAELRTYCYVVAGIVGELLTELFVDAVPALGDVEPTLRAHAAAFGEGLQLVNIMKDAPVDTRRGRIFVPPTMGRGRALALSREDLGRARVYVAALESAGAPRGIVKFCAFPVLLAMATLDAQDRVGIGAKVSRGTVARLLGDLNAAPDARDRDVIDGCVRADASLHLLP